MPEITCGGFTASGEKLSVKHEAEKIRMDCDGQDVSVLSVEKQVKTVQPPRLYDLTTLQRECNRIYGYTAQQTLDYVQSLYEKKLATYPRTDSQLPWFSGCGIICLLERATPGNRILTA